MSVTQFHLFMWPGHRAVRLCVMSTKGDHGLQMTSQSLAEGLPRRPHLTSLEQIFFTLQGKQFQRLQSPGMLWYFVR